MPQNETIQDLDLDDYKYDFVTEAEPVYRAQKGLSEEVVRQISRHKAEPEWMLDFRLKALKVYESKPMPKWGGDLDSLEEVLDEIYFYVRPQDRMQHSWDDVPDEIKDTFEKLGIPAITTQMGKGVVDETGPHFLGNTALSDGDFVHRAIGAADLIINVGHDVVEKPPFFMQPGGATVVHVNFNSAQVDPVYFPQIELVGDIANSLWQLKERLEPQEHWSFADFHRVRDALQAHIAEGERDDRFPILPPRLVREIRKVMPDDGTIALDNGMYKIWFARNYPATHPNTVLLDNALASMGAGLPSAMAAKMVHPDRRVMAVCGDGGFMMNSQELETAVRLRLDLVVLILRDDGYGMIKWKQKQMDFHDFGLDFQNPDFVAYAKAYGAQGHRVESTEGLGPLVEECFAAGGVHVIDLPVDYSDNDRVLNQEIRELSRKV